MATFRSIHTFQLEEKIPDFSYDPILKCTDPIEYEKLVPFVESKDHKEFSIAFITPPCKTMGVRSFGDKKILSICLEDSTFIETLDAIRKNVKKTMKSVFKRDIDPKMYRVVGDRKYLSSHVKFFNNKCTSRFSGTEDPKLMEAPCMVRLCIQLKHIFIGDSCAVRWNLMEARYDGEWSPPVVDFFAPNEDVVF
jgi:hypothetical protein